MTIGEAQALRAKVFATYSAQLTGGIQSYGVNGRSVTKIDPAALLKQLNDLDFLISRLQGNGAAVAQFRKPE